MSSLYPWFRGVRGKLLLSTALPLIALTIVSGFGFYGLRTFDSYLDRAYGQVTPTVDSINRMNTAKSDILRYFWKAYSLKTDISARNQSLQKIREAVADYKKNEEIYNPLPQMEKEVPVDKAVKAAEAEMFKGLDEMLVLLEKHSLETDEQAKSLLTGKYLDSFTTVEKGLDDIAHMYTVESQEQTALVRAQSDKLIFMILATSAVSAITLFVLMILMASRLANALGRLTGSIAESGHQVGSASYQLSTASQQLSSGAVESASSLEETVSSLEELSSMVKKNSENSKEASDLSQASCASAEEGENEIRRLIGAMTEISQSSKKIEEIINVIDDIAFQTNLLALNAAVEAARAGEQGKGFAVVAEAVRNLAQRSSSAAKDITVLIKNSVDQVADGRKIADESGEVLEKIVTSVKQVSRLNNEIATASKEQFEGLSQISLTMNNLDQATQRNAASAEETAAASEEMSAQANELQVLVTQLGDIVDGQNAGASLAPVISIDKRRRVA